MEATSGKIGTAGLDASDDRKTKIRTICAGTRLFTFTDYPCKVLLAWYFYMIISFLRVFISLD